MNKETADLFTKVATIVNDGGSYIAIGLDRDFSKEKKIEQLFCGMTLKTRRDASKVLIALFSGLMDKIGVKEAAQLWVEIPELCLANLKSGGIVEKPFNPPKNE